MTGRIFRSILTTSMVVLAAALLVITSFLYTYYTVIQKNQLRDELMIIASAAERSGVDYLESLPSDNYRVTLVGNDGTVLFDSQANASEMDNHLSREEIAQALKTGKGSSSRYSATLTEQTLYEAVLLSDKTVLRISVKRASGLTLLLGMIYPIIFIIIVAIIISAVLAHKMAKRIIEPLNKLDLDHPTENDAYEEIAPLLNRIHRQNMKIEHKAGELNRKKEEFNLITENMREGLVLLDKDRCVITINPAAARLFETDTSCAGREFLTVDRRRDINAALDSALENGHSDIRAQRGEREYRFDISRIETSGETVGAVILASDITEQANAERMRREFTANVSHELKTPLQSITGSAELIENGLVKPEDMPRFIGHIRTEATRLVTLVDDIIRLSQLDEGGEMQRETVSLQAVSGEVFDLLRESAAARNITLNQSGFGEVFGVKQLMFEIIYNLCDNAIKYNRDGGRVDVDIRESEEETVLSVSDTGIGIPPEHRERIFERFYRVDKSHSKKSGGTGLGLSIVKHAVLYHNGKITLESEENKGTTITAVFPKNR